MKHIITPEETDQGEYIRAKLVINCPVVLHMPVLVKSLPFLRPKEAKDAVRREKRRDHRHSFPEGTNPPNPENYSTK